MWKLARENFQKTFYKTAQIATPDCIADANLQRGDIVEFLPEDEEERVGKVHVADEVGQMGHDGHVVSWGPRLRIPVNILAPWRYKIQNTIFVCRVFNQDVKQEEQVTKQQLTRWVTHRPYKVVGLTQYCYAILVFCIASENRPVDSVFGHYVQRRTIFACLLSEQHPGRARQIFLAAT